MIELPSAQSVTWRRVGFEEAMETFYAATDLVVARAGGAVAELTATGTPAILVPGQFGSAGHQAGNAKYLTESGAAATLEESELDSLDELVESILSSPDRLAAMRAAATRIARPGAARDIARAMIEASE
jgi:UDP-N-acetylglucosamine--N-acetylmuramyl-(pentapeptide) pyrophosphoryl-undecaprenol N-acetylglucosamine transferase